MPRYIRGVTGVDCCRFFQPELYLARYAGGPEKPTTIYIGVLPIYLNTYGGNNNATGPNKPRNRMP